jgi:heat shock protein HslJ
MRSAAPALALVLVLAACTAGSSGSPGASGPIDLQGSWVLTSGTGPAGPLVLVEGSRVTISFSGSQVSGQSACNQYGGTVAVAGNAIHFSAMSTTEMACAEPIMGLEAAYWEAFALVTRVVRQGDTLTLSGQGSRLDFEPLPEVADAALVGTSWTLDSLIFGDAVSSVQGSPTLELRDDGTLVGSTGCRDLTARYQVTGDEVQVSDLAAAGTCTTDLAQQDELVVGVLDGSFTISIDGLTLTIAGDGGQGLGYRAAD